jgi:hypothetical protein
MDICENCGCDKSLTNDKKCPICPEELPSALSDKLAGLVELREHYRIVDIGKGDFGIYPKKYNIRCATIHKGNSILVEILQVLTSDRA